MASAVHIIFIIAGTLLASTSLGVLTDVTTSLLDQSSEQREFQQVANLEREINSTCSEGQQSSGTRIKLNDQRLKLEEDRILIKDEGEQFEEIGNVKCEITEEIQIPEGSTDRSRFTVRTEKTDEGYRVK